MAKEDPEHTEAVIGTAPLSKSQRFKRHCARRWWIWLIGFLIFVLVIVIIVIYGIIPPVAQKTLDKTKLNIESLTIRKPTPKQFEFSVVSYITGSSSLAHKATIDPMEVGFYLEGQEPFMYLPLPGVHGGDKILVEKVNHTTTIPDSQAFGTFAATLMVKKEFELGIYGETKIHLGAIKTKVKYREWVTLKGMNKLEGMVIVQYSLASGDYAISGKVLIPNPTVFTLELGDVLIDISLNDEYLGNGIIPSITVTPGMEHIYDFKANLTVENLLKLGASVRKGPTSLQIQTTGVEYGGVNIPWLSVPMGAVVIDVPINTTYFGNTTTEN
ncbi:hypothetical protein BDZ91DRAFT_714249 [Kalaharituber pfeilii]|nr:hypothetical protein BDZ91DRAFT_714249 [Kalaharituber pfeilii]